MMKYVKLFETFKVDERAPDYDEANFNLDKIFGDDQESIETFQEIEDRNDVNDMIDYINNWGDEEEMGRYGITTAAHIKKFAKSILESVNEGRYQDAYGWKGNWLGTKTTRAFDKTLSKPNLPEHKIQKELSKVDAGTVISIGQIDHEKLGKNEWTTPEPMQGSGNWDMWPESRKGIATDEHLASMIWDTYQTQNYTITKVLKVGKYDSLKDAGITESIKRVSKTFASFKNSLEDSKNLNHEFSHLSEGRKFAKAVNDAREQGLEEFEFNGKTYPVKEKKEKVVKEKEERIEESNNVWPAPGINKQVAHKMLFENNSTVHGLLSKITEDVGDWTLEMELEKNPKAAVVFWEPGMKGDTNTTDLKDARLYLHNFYSMTAAKNYHGLIVKMLNHPSFKDNPNPRDKNRNQFPEQMNGDMSNVKVMMMKDFVKKYPKATKAIAEWPGAMWDESPWSYMYDRYFNANATKFKL